MSISKEQAKPPHIYELDPIRTCTALSVVAVHVLAFTVHLNASEIGYQIQNAVIVAFHFTREVFMFVTAFALVYVYNRRSISLMQFWRKRGVSVALPYIFWSMVYILTNSSFSSVGAFLRTTVFDLLTGRASYQLYYILLTLQFYLFFPLFLPFIRCCARHPWITLSVSAALQLLLFSVDYHMIQNSTSPFWQKVSSYQDSFFPIYQFYFILGGLTAFYFKQVRAFALRHGRIIVSALLLALAGLWLHFTLQIDTYHESIGYATSVLQPIMVFYSVVVIFFALWLAAHWARKAGTGKRPRGYRFWHTLSDASFGVYLIHALILTALLKWIVPALPTVWPVAMRVSLTWLTTVSAATGISTLLLNVPFVSRLIGRSGPHRRRRTEPGTLPTGDLAHPLKQKEISKAGV